ncbi:MAG TPA: hypothetical protein VNL17_14305 [Verrucomicrobiae bacterium]|nr:hypothetical protein [Verrucomicrobiae bacterium]
MKLAFKLVSAGGLIDRAIGWWTQSPYCHVELVFDQMGVPDDCFSADPKRGVRFTHVDWSDTKTWKVVGLAVSESQERVAYFFARDALVGRKYNKRGILRFLFGFVSSKPNEEFCSQVILIDCQHIGLWPGDPPVRIDPGFLAQLAEAE